MLRRLFLGHDACVPSGCYRRRIGLRKKTSARSDLCKKLVLGQREHILSDVLIEVARVPIAHGARLHLHAAPLLHPLLNLANVLVKPCKATPTYTDTHMEIHMHLHRQKHTETHTYTCRNTHTYSHTHTYIQIFAHICKHVRTFIHTRMRTCIRTYIHERVCTLTHTYIHTYIHTYTHTYIHTYIHTCTAQTRMSPQ